MIDSFGGADMYGRTIGGTQAQMAEARACLEQLGIDDDDEDLLDEANQEKDEEEDLNDG